MRHKRSPRSRIKSYRASITGRDTTKPRLAASFAIAASAIAPFWFVVSSSVAGMGNKRSRQGGRNVA